jgi:hypothetical protein
MPKVHHFLVERAQFPLIIRMRARPKATGYLSFALFVPYFPGFRVVADGHRASRLGVDKLGFPSWDSRLEANRSVAHRTYGFRRLDNLRAPSPSFNPKRDHEQQNPQAKRDD